MGDWGSDCESSVALAMEEAGKLHKLDPNHELLKYCCVTPEEEKAGGSTPERDHELHVELKNRFWNRPEPWQDVAGVIVTTVVYSGYWVALREAVARAAPRPAA